MPADTPSTDFGARLRAAREQRGLTLRVVADATKISVRALEALERNEIARLPGGIFSRAFVRAYAVEVGLDPEQAVAEFITRFPDEIVTQGHPRTRAIVDELEAERDVSGGVPLIGRVAIVVALAVLALALYYGLSSRRAAVDAAPATSMPTALALRHTQAVDASPRVLARR